MSGHSKWASIKHKKGALDAKKGKIFSKIVKEITVMAKRGGGNPDQNPGLRLILQKAKESNMPQDNIDRAIKKGTGELPGVVYEEIHYEGYGPSGVAIMVEALSDNKNRTTGEVRNVFDKKKGNMAAQGAVSWQFSKKGIIVVSKNDAEEEKLMDIAIDAGAQDFNVEKDFYEIITEVNDYEAVKKAIDDSGINTQSSEITMIPSNTVKVPPEDRKGVLALVEALEDLDDVQNVYSNFDIPDDELETEA